MRNPWKACLLLAMAATSAAGAPARAQAPPAPLQPTAPVEVEKADKGAGDRADELARRGIALGRKDRWAEAEPFFREAWALKRSYDIGGNLGLAEATLGQWRPSAEHLRYALKTFPANGKPEHRKLLEQVFAKARAKVGALSIQVNVRGAQVLVDGEEVGVSPLDGEVFVDPGARTIEAKLSGYEGPQEVVAVAPGGAAQPVQLELTATAEKAPGGLDPRGKPKEEPGWRPDLPWVLAGGALTLATLVTGIGLTAASEGEDAEAEEMKEPFQGDSSVCHAPPPQLLATCARLEDTITDKHTYRHAATVSFVASGLFAAGTVAFAIWWRSGAERDTRVRVTPVVGAGHGGVAVFGAW